MNEKTEKKYIQIMRRKSGQEKIKSALRLKELALKLAEKDIKNLNQKISFKALKVLLQKRIYGFSFPFKISSQKVR